MNTPRKHAAVIHAWADGAKVQCRRKPDADWEDLATPAFHAHREYRVKPPALRWRPALFAGEVVFNWNSTSSVTQMEFAVAPGFLRWLDDEREVA